jgi:hypothetical protein
VVILAAVINILYRQINGHLHISRILVSIIISLCETLSCIFVSHINCTFKLFLNHYNKKSRQKDCKITNDM